MTTQEPIIPICPLEPSAPHNTYLPKATKSKVRLFTTREAWEPVLRELIDPSELPLEYGGTGPNRLMERLLDPS
jgi:hypothetical protein